MSGSADVTGTVAASRSSEPMQSGEVEIARAPARGAHLNLRLLRPVARYLREAKGPDALIRVADSLGLSPVELERGSVWVSAAEFEHLLEAAQQELGSVDELRTACAYKMAEEYGPLRFVVRATTPYALFRQAAKQFHVISRISRFDVEQPTATHLRIRYTTTQQEGRLSCISRQAQMSRAPALWGLPPAKLEERGCVAHGDDACVYDLRLYQHRRWLPVLVGLLGGIVAGGMLVALGSWLVGLLVIGLGALLGYTYELSRTNHENLRIGEEANEQLRRLTNEEAEARLELVELHRRQRRWAQLLEEQLSERTSAMHLLMDRLRRVSEERVNTLRGVSHDLNNPLLVLMSNTSMLASQGADPAVVHDMENSIDRMRRLLRELMHNLTGEVAVPWRHEELDVRELTEQLRRRMRALVFGRDIRISVFRSREAPDAVRCDPILFDRVVDNLFTNAAKYTEAGSILVELGGTPGYLTLKISDTGRGISPEMMQQIFSPGGSDERSRAPGSFGVGLSVVVHLLARIGGRLEVMSTPGLGTTFWAHFPVHPIGLDQFVESPTEELELRRVLTIRGHQER